jgi:hypothetical protein
MTRLQIKAIIAAYELGLASAQRPVRMNPYQPDSDDFTAWSIGCKAGRQLAQCTPRVQDDFQPSGWPEQPAKVVDRRRAD